MAPARKRTAQRRRVAAVTLAVLAHAALLSLLFSGNGRLPFQPTWQERPTEIWLAPPLVLKQPPPAPQRRPEARSTPSARSAATAPPAPGPQPPSQTQSPAPAPSASGAAAPGPGFAAALRKSVGCAEPNAPWMSDADRAACRNRLAAGAASAPHLEAMPAMKLAYFNAVAKAQADWQSGRNAGHGLAIGCIKKLGPGVRTAPPPHALKLGPCMIEPPRGSLDVDVDILPDGTTAQLPPGFVTSATRAP